MRALTPSEVAEISHKGSAIVLGLKECLRRSKTFYISPAGQRYLKKKKMEEVLKKGTVVDIGGLKLSNFLNRKEPVSFFGL